MSSEGKGYEITGRVVKVGDKQEFASGFYKREVVVETSGEYPQTIPIEFAKKCADKVEQYGIAEGDVVTVQFDLRGREWNGRYFCNLSGWRIEKQAAAPTSATAQPAPTGDAVQDGLDQVGDGGGADADSLPF